MIQLCIYVCTLNPFIPDITDVSIAEWRPDFLRNKGTDHAIDSFVREQTRKCMASKKVKFHSAVLRISVVHVGSFCDVARE